MVTVYTKPNCQPCRLTKARLDQMGIEYESIDVTGDTDLIETLARMGYRTLPVVLVSHDYHWSGFRPDKIAALEKAGTSGTINSSDCEFDVYFDGEHVGRSVPCDPGEGYRP